MTKSNKTESQSLIVDSTLPGPLRLQVGEVVVSVEPGQHTMQVTPALREQLAVYGDRIRIYQAA